MNISLDEKQKKHDKTEEVDNKNKRKGMRDGIKEAKAYREWEWYSLNVKE